MSRRPAAWYALLEHDAMPEYVRHRADAIGTVLLWLYAGAGTALALAGILGAIVARGPVRTGAAGVALFGVTWALLPWRVASLRPPRRLLGLAVCAFAGAVVAVAIAGARAAPLGAGLGMLASYAEAAVRAGPPGPR